MIQPVYTFTLVDTVAEIDLVDLFGKSRLLYCKQNGWWYERGPTGQGWCPTLSLQAKWANVQDKPLSPEGGASWGTVEGDLADQTDLVAVLDGKAPTHAHPYEPVDNNIQAHISAAHAPSNAQKNSDITKPEIEAKLTGVITSHSHSGGSDPWNIVTLETTFTTNGVANANVTNFFFTPQANKTYLVFGYFLVRTATATTGARPGLAWPTVSDGASWVAAPSSNTAEIARFQGARTTQNAASTGLPTTTDSYLARLEALIVAGATPSGNVQVTLASETAAVVVSMMANSKLMYREV